MRYFRHEMMLRLFTGNTGLGKESVLQLAKHNPSHIYLAARTPSKAQAAIQDIQREVPSASVTFLDLDLTSFSSISSAAREFTAHSRRLDILLNNAGIMAVPAGTTKEGYEIQFGTNHMGHALLTKLLLPTLLSTAKDGSDVRIVNLTSEGHNMAPSGGILFDKSKLDAQGTWARYGQSKLANILYTRELASRNPSITCVSVHPGIVETDLYASTKETNLLVKYLKPIFGPLIMQNPAQGARNQLWAATTDKEKLVNGGYYTPVANLHKGGWMDYTQDKKLGAQLWDWTQEELAAKGY